MEFNIDNNPKRYEKPQIAVSIIFAILISLVFSLTIWIVMAMLGFDVNNKSLLICFVVILPIISFLLIRFPQNNLDSEPCEKVLVEGNIVKHLKRKGGIYYEFESVSIQDISHIRKSLEYIEGVAGTNVYYSIIDVNGKKRLVINRDIMNQYGENLLDYFCNDCSIPVKEEIEWDFVKVFGLIVTLGFTVWLLYMIISAYIGRV